MPSPVKFCSCHGCKAGKPCPAAKASTRRKVRGHRNNVKRRLHAGDYEPPKTISAGMTD